MWWGVRRYITLHGLHSIVRDDDALPATHLVGEDRQLIAPGFIQSLRPVFFPCLLLASCYTVICALDCSGSGSGSDFRSALEYGYRSMVLAFCSSHAVFEHCLECLVVFQYEIRVEIEIEIEIDFRVGIGVEVKLKIWLCCVCVRGGRAVAGARRR